MSGNTRKIKSAMLYRDIPVARESVDSEARTVELAFSSESPVERWFGNEILDHGSSSVRLQRLKDAGPLLVDHNPRDHVGVVEEVQIGSDRRGRSVVRFGRSARAEEVFRDVLDGIRTKVSVGYMIHKMVLESKEGDSETYRAIDWEPMEISLVSVPADPSVGIGRANEQPQHDILIEEKQMPDKDKDTPAHSPGTSAVNAEEIRNQVRANELKRIKDIEAIGRAFSQFGGADMARECIASGKSVEEMNAILLERIGKQAPPSAEIGLTQKEAKRFNWLRALNALANPQDRKAQETAAYEREVSDAAAKQTGKTPRGLLVPVDVLRAPLLVEGTDPMNQLARMMARILSRDLTVGVSTAGGHTVSTDLLAASFIDLLRNRMVMQRMGMTVLNGLVGNIGIPRQTSGATAYWVAESGAPTESQQAFDQVTMSPKTVGAFTDYSRKLLLQSSIDVENFVRMDLTKVIGLELDRVALYGSGSANQPLGVKNVTGINTKDFTAAAPTYAEVVDLETAVAADNADIGTLAYLVNATGRGGLKTTEKAAGTAQFIWEPGNTVNGYRAEVSNQVEAGDFWFGNWSDVVAGFWSGLDLIVDPYTGSTSGNVRIVAMQDVDIAIRHPESFARGNNTL